MVHYFLKYGKEEQKTDFTVSNHIQSAAGKSVGGCFATALQHMSESTVGSTYLFRCESQKLKTEMFSDSVFYAEHEKNIKSCKKLFLNHLFDAK